MRDDPLDKLTKAQAIKALKDVREQLWPEGNPDQEWDSDTVESVSIVILELDPRASNPHGFDPSKLID
jgi:hypothetical protein